MDGESTGICSDIEMGVRVTARTTRKNLLSLSVRVSLNFHFVVSPEYDITFVHHLRDMRFLYSVHDARGGRIKERSQHAGIRSLSVSLVMAKNK